MKKEIMNDKVKVNTLLCILLTVSLGALTGCSDTKDDAPAINDVFMENITDTVISEAFDNEEAEDSSAIGELAVENVRVLTIMKGGEPEKKQAELVVGEEYFIYLPQGDWQQSGSDEWTASVNEQVHLWITHFEGKSIESANDAVAAEGYVAQEYGDMAKLQGETIYKVRLYEFESDIWGVFYCFPAEAEEGWGTELSVITDTFGLWTATDGDWIHFEY